MTETLSQGAEAQMSPAEQAFYNSLDTVAGMVPEINVDRVEIESGGRQLIEEFDIDQSLFEGETETLLFGAIAQRSAQLEANKNSMTDDEYRDEKTFIADSTMLLALDKSGLYPQVAESIRTDPELSDRQIASVYDKYTNHQVSAELTEAVKSGVLLKDVKERMHITDDDEDPYDVRVLNIANGKSLFGMNPTIDYGSLTPRTKEWDDAMSTTEDFKKYQAELMDNEEAMKAELGETIPFAQAWVEVVGGRKQLCLPLPMAEKLLYKDEARTSLYTEKAQEADLAILEHEYVHTQKNVNVGNSVFLGVTLEELRAEHFSGNKQGYYGIKNASTDLKLITGLSTSETLEDAAASGDPFTTYSTFANTIGLQRTLEYALLPPSEYIHDARPMQKGVNEYLGGHNAFTQRLYDAEAADPEKREAMSARIRKYAEVIKAFPENGEAVLNDRDKRYGLTFMSDKIRTEIRQIDAEAA